MDLLATQAPDLDFPSLLDGIMDVQIGPRSGSRNG